MTKLIQTHAIALCLLAGCSSTVFTEGEADGGDAAYEEAAEGGAEAAVDAGVDAEQCGDDSVIICGGACPAGRYHYAWLRDGCDSGFLWECRPLCGDEVIRCIVSNEPCPSGWSAVEEVYVDRCGPQEPTNAWLCSQNS